MTGIDDGRGGLGAWGERRAAEHLERLGWRVVDRNWRCPLGELDILALEPNPDGAPTGVVVEVKCRAGTGFGDPLEAITEQKLARLRRLAASWRQQCGLRLGGLRIDAIGIVKVRGEVSRLRHVRGIA
ncbi:YraN family protein [Brooklawnia cerclae]|uniref:UPF0102 protein FB473_002015 n=1 Tax=Brooklawnia cerclae TaxID=349934 RepID=A0ABX0SHD0_9ACTN|nr:YraN family protein [Brooklawnia cerclae]NIH57370.1 putative endonuclease [Brooklawnia cerclae]